MSARKLRESDTRQSAVRRSVKEATDGPSAAHYSINLNVRMERSPIFRRTEIGLRPVPLSFQRPFAALPGVFCNCWAAFVSIYRIPRMRQIRRKIVSEQPKGEMDVKFKAFVERTTWYRCERVRNENDVGRLRSPNVNA